MNKILYLHGFASASDSTKAQQLNNHIKNNTSDITIHIPNIENNISLAVDQIESLIKKIKPTVIMGCSLGGFFGTYFSEKYNLVYANILQNVLLLETDYLTNSLHSGGALILSGLLAGQEEEVIKSYKEKNPNLQFVETIKKGDWVAVLMEMN